MVNNDKYIYLEVPIDYVCVYNKLMTYLADYGMELLDECDSACKQTNKNLIKCWNMFQAAIAAKEIGNDKEADVLITYINAQLDSMYSNSKEDIVYEDKILPIDEKGYVYGTITCKRIIEFYVHIDETNDDFRKGSLYVKVLSSASSDIEFQNITDINNNLLYKEI